MSDVKSDSFLDSLCTQIYRIQLVFLVALVFLLLSIVSLFFLEPGTPSYIVNTANIAGLSVVVVVFGYVSYRCNNREL